MAEEKELSKFERELVLQYLRDDNVPLTVILDDREEQKKDVPFSAVFPVAIPSKQITVLDEGIILLKSAGNDVEPFLGKKICVQFYFNHLGLYFVTTMKRHSDGFAVEVPSSIRRIPSVAKTDYEFVGTVSYAVKNTEICIDCLPLDDYKIFCQPKWSDVAPESQMRAKQLLEEFISDVKSGQRNPVGNGVHLIAVVKYLTEKNAVTLNESIEGRAKPFNMIYMDDKRIVLAASEGSDILHSDMRYNFSFEFSLPANKMLRRKINAECEIQNIFVNPDFPHKKCYSLRFEKLKEEDWRFLYERRGKMSA